MSEPVPDETSPDGKWDVFGDPTLVIKGFRIGDRVQWKHIGPIYTIQLLLRSRNEHRNWYAYASEKDGTLKNWGIEYLTQVEVIDALADVSDVDC